MGNLSGAIINPLMQMGMKNPLKGHRARKERVFELLKRSDFNKALEELSLIPERLVINPLFSFLQHGDESIKWNAVRAMGAVVSKLADKDMEGARVVMRRLMWNLNDESGGIGWGSPEAMGEILSHHEGVANEYAHILLSYARVDGNYLEHEMLQRGLLWGIGRLTEARPHLVRGAASHLLPFLYSPDVAVRGLAAWVMGLLGLQASRSALECLAEDNGELSMLLGGHLQKCTVKELATEALWKLSSDSE